MDQFEFLISFAAIILALAICDLAVSLNRLLQAGARVKWDWLAPLAGVVAFLKIVTQWWDWYNANTLARAMTFSMFLAVLIGTVLLFLMTSSTLPDEVGEEGVDLRQFYASVSRRFWLLFAAHWVVATAASIWIQMAIDHARLSLASPVYLIVPVAVGLALTKNRAVHGVFLLGFAALYIGQSFGHTLGH